MSFPFLQNPTFSQTVTSSRQPYVVQMHEQQDCKQWRCSTIDGDRWQLSCEHSGRGRYRWLCGWFLVHLITLYRRISVTHPDQHNQQLNKIEQVNAELFPSIQPKMMTYADTN